MVEADDGRAFVGFVRAEVLRGADDFRMIAYGVVLLVLLRLRPQGLAGVR